MEQIFRLFLAGLLGLLLGAERELQNKSAGLRTCSMISLISCLITLVSIFMFEKYPNHADPTRIASNLVQGIGWIGAGVIVHQGVNASGLTTATIIFSAMGIGLACGSGAYLLAIFGTLFILGMILGLNKVKQKFYPKDPSHDA